MQPAKRTAVIWAIILFVIIIGVAGYSVYKKKIGSIAIPNSESSEVEKRAAAGELVPFLTTPDGFSVSYFAKGIPGARTMAIDPKGRLLVASTDKGTVTALEDFDGDGIPERRYEVLSDLDKPHGMAFKCTDAGCDLYIAERNQLAVYGYDADAVTVSNNKKLLDIESAVTDRHFTRSLLFLGSPHENILLISVGSSCNVCNEKGSQRGKILAYDIATGAVSEYAKGLRNAVFMTLNPFDGKVFATEMGRDGLGDNIPPDEINVIDPESWTAATQPNFGWPICYGKNIHDTDFDKNTYIRNPCMAPFETPSWLDLQAHSAPLGLAFVPEEGWPEDLWGDVFVAYHGSWNRSVPTGYKIVRIVTDSRGNPTDVQDFITGWLAADGKKLGRPADVLVLSGGVMYVTDDETGVVYRIIHN